MNIIWLGYKYTKKEIFSLKEFSEKLEKKGFVKLYDFELKELKSIFKNTNTLYCDSNPFSIEIEGTTELIWNINKEELETQSSLLADEI